MDCIYIKVLTPFIIQAKESDGACKFLLIFDHRKPIISSKVVNSYDSEEYKSSVVGILPSAEKI